MISPYHPRRVESSVNPSERICQTAADWGDKSYHEYTVSGAPSLLSSLPQSGPQIQQGGLGSSPSSVRGRHILSLGNASGDNSFGSYVTGRYSSGGPINFMKQEPTEISPGFPADQSAPDVETNNFCNS